ncbi:phage head closure protein [Sedimentitalea todarodis]|uniref:Phage head closure protein n=1 Tax=Sedimentitalea todarodis TaxID=1631240 RepID=A0ABU3VCM0_9RHOB|nr:phage head closure protein [Sedimentitalea todarodis]MDU9003894.1 phage head closure protein [Sedimentitalea todarodis]
MTMPYLNRKLVLETPRRVPDGAGGYTQSWESLGELWAEVRSRTGRERAEAGVTVSSVSYRIVVRGAPHGTAARPMPGQRFREGTRLYVIQAVAEQDPQARYLTCFADEEIVA